jgi:hypothetical protein
MPTAGYALIFLGVLSFCLGALMYRVFIIIPLMGFSIVSGLSFAVFSDYTLTSSLLLIGAILVLIQFSYVFGVFSHLLFFDLADRD